MARKKRNPGTDDMHTVMRRMRISMLNKALKHFSHLDARTCRVLQNLNLLREESISIGSDVDISVLRDSEHPRRQKLSAGPLILYITSDKKPRRVATELQLLLLSEISAMRKAALGSLEKMIRKEGFNVTQKTDSIIRNSRLALMSNASSKWRPAAVAISDALNDDVLVALQGVRQCLENAPVLKDSLNFYNPKVLKPSISSLDSIRLEINNPENEHEQISQIISEIITNAGSLADVCSGYYAKLGYLPLAPRYSMAEAVQRWLASHPNIDAWKEIWEWAQAAFGPIPKYHACFVFIRYPELVPQEKLADLWNAILDVVCVTPTKQNGGEENEAWVLRRDLVRHYTYHLEALLPGNAGANIATFAWWFSEQVARLFPDEPNTIRFYLENWVHPALESSSHTWIMASPRIQRSFLRYVTLMISSPWAMALLSIMGDKLELLLPSEQSDEIRVKFQDSLVMHIISCLPFPIQSPDDPTFALECSLSETVLQWVKHQPDELKKPLEQLIATSQTLGTADGLYKALRKLGESSLADQIVVILALKTKAYIDPTIAESVWKVVSDTAWRQDVLGNLELRVLCMFIEVLSIMEVDNDDKWFSWLPHYIAELCDKTDDEERRRYLFRFVLHTSLVSETVSAVRRLLCGDHKDKFVELNKECRAMIEATRSEYPPWVVGKLRGLIANLRVA